MVLNRLNTVKYSWQLFLMKAEWGDRLTAFLEAKLPEEDGWSWNKRSREIGVTAASLSNWRNSQPDFPPGELVAKLIDAFSEFDANYTDIA